MPDTVAVILATFRPRSDKVDELRGLLEDMVRSTRQEPGCRTYDLYQSDEADHPLFHLFERYDDALALGAHRGSDHYMAYRSKLPDLIEEPVRVTCLTELDVAR